MQKQIGSKIYNYFHVNKNLWVIILLGFFIRLYAFMHNYVINNDSASYIYQAKAISNHMWDAARSCNYSFISMYVFFIMPFYKIFNDWIIAARAVSIFFGTITLIPLYFLIKRFFSKEVTAIVLLVYAFNPLLVRENTEIMTDTVFWFFSILGLYLFVKAVDKNKNKVFILSSLSFCLASFTRLEGLIFILGSLLFMIFRKNRDIKNILSFSFPLILLIIISGSSFLFHNGGQSPLSLYILPRFKALYLGFFENPFRNNMTNKLIDLNSQYIEFIPINFFTYVKMTLWSVAFGILLTKTIPAFYFPFFVLFVIGFKNLKKEIKREPLTGYLFFLSIFIFIFLYIFILKTWVMEKRYVASLIFPSFIFIGFGLQTIIDFLRVKGFKEKLLIPILCILTIAVTLPLNLKPIRKDKLHIREIGELIAIENPNENIQVATSDVRVIFYANMSRNDLMCPAPVIDYKGLTHKKYPEMITLLREKNIKYFLWEEDKWKFASYDFMKEVNTRDMVEVGRWEIDQNRLVLFKIAGGKA